MKHLGRWLICLALPLNSLLFIAFVLLGATGMYVFFGISLLCYPLSLYILRLARIHINSKCCFYRKEDAIWWNIIKTVLMPIMASGALIMFHLITTTFRKMNDDVEDKTGFSIASILRTAKAFVVYVLAGILLYLITEWFSKDYGADGLMVGLLILGCLIWLLNHILWDVLDFAHRESDRFIGIKNMVFLVVAAVCALWGLVCYPGSIPKQANFSELIGQFGMMVAPLGIHFFYYGIIRTGQVPQSKMTYLWGAISMAAVYLYTLLVGWIATSGKVFVLIFYLLTVLAYGAVMYFGGFPFFYSDGEYRNVYRELSKERRLARARAASASYGDASSTAVKTESNASIYEAASRVARKTCGYGAGVHLSAIAAINNVKLYLKSTEQDDVSYDLYYTFYVDLRGKKESDAEFALNSARADFKRGMEKLEYKICQNTVRELSKNGVNVSQNTIHIYYHGQEEIVY